MRFAYIIEPPFNFIDGQGAVTGHDVEIARHVCKALGKSFEPVETTFADLLPGLGRGDWQFATGMFATPDRLNAALFSTPIWALGDGLLVAKGNPKGLRSYADLARAKAVLAVLIGQEQRNVALACGVDADRIREFRDYSDAAEAVRRGDVDAYASVFEAHTGYLSQHNETRLDAVAIPEHEKPVSFGSLSVARDATGLKSAIDGVLSAYIGGDQHLGMAARFGFTSAQIERVA